MHFLTLGIATGLLVVAFLLKLLVDRSPSVPELLRAILEFPVDLAFCAASLMVGLLLSSTASAWLATLLLLWYLPILVVAVLLWRRSEKLLLQDRFGPVVSLGILNYLLGWLGVGFILYITW